MPKRDIDERVRSAAQVLGLSDHLHRLPRALSGGQRQRVAMGRAIVREPSVFLMDEPLSNLDAKLRVQMRAEIARTTRRLGVTTLYVTHDQVEAMTLGDRVAVLKKGVLQQVARPQELYDRPVNMFVAGFIGSPPMNLLQGVFSDSEAGPVLRLGDQEIAVSPGLLAERPGLRGHLGRTVAIGIRPEDLEDEALAPPGSATMTATVDLTEALGSDLIAHCQIAAPGVVNDDTRELAADSGADDPATSAGPARSTIVARFSPRSRVRENDVIQIAVDTARLHVFDPVGGQAIW
jgi:multiple sugar transport system ATP-binding protein